MASNSTSSNPALPNPYTVLAFLPPTFADQFQTTCYVYVALLSAFTWEWLASMGDEYRILRKGGLSLPIFAYFLSRIGTLSFCITTTVLQAAPVAHCQAVLYISGSFLMLSQASTSLLFFVRVKAIYSNSKIVTGFFAFAWLVNLGVSVLVPLALDADHIGPTNRCIATVVRPYASVTLIVNTAFDSLIFLMISFKIVSRAVVGETWSARIRCFLTGDGLPFLSRGLLQGGQLYYLTTVSLSVIMCVLAFSPHVPDIFKGMFAMPALAIPSIMACYVFRAIKLGVIKDFGVNSASRTPLSRVHFTHTDDISLHPDTFDSSRNNVEIRVIKTTHIERDAEDDYAFGKLNSLGESSLGDESADKQSDRV